ncbi:MAG TPA: condensation domain-containing protein, partial [Blastocatellia bacterium]|nr:condensation domain-containing protein [Blastocatellia bacterium]
MDRGRGKESEGGRRRGEGIRARVERIGGGEEVLVVSVRGMRGDGITVRRVIEEVEEEVEGRREEREVVQYADLSEFFNQLLEADDAESISGRRYWSERNAALSKALRLPFERRPEAPLFQPQSISSGFDPDVAAQIEALAHQHRSSPESVLLACWQVLLCRLTGEREIIVARSFDTRSYNELHGVLGPLTRYLPIPISFEDQDCLSGVLSKLDEAMRAALAFKDYFSWEQVAGRKQSADDLAYIPVCFEYIEWPDRIAGAGTALSLSHLYTCLERYKLRLCCIRRADTLLTEFHFDSSCFS